MPARTERTRPALRWRRLRGHHVYRDLLTPHLPGASVPGRQSPLLQFAGGALNGRRVADPARELDVGERHHRRAFEREVGVSPVELAQTHRLLLAKRLLTDTSLSATRVAEASGFQSLRRFNAACRERYGMCPSDVRGADRLRDGTHLGTAHGLGLVTSEYVRLTLAYRTPFAWDALPGAELVQGQRYARTVRLEGRSGIRRDQGDGLLENAGTKVDEHSGFSVFKEPVPLIAPDRVKRGTLLPSARP